MGHSAPSVRLQVVKSLEEELMAVLPAHATVHTMVEKWLYKNGPKGLGGQAE